MNPARPTSSRAAHARRLQPLLRVAASLALMAALLLWLEPRALAAAFGAPAPLWLLAALALSIPQVALSAWRWRLTAERLGAPLRFGEALREYYLATFLNQVLPGGVMGDAARALRHARRHRFAGAQAPPPEPRDSSPLVAWHAVIIERASGQCALLLVVLATLPLAPALRSAGAELLGALGSGSPVSRGLVLALLLVLALAATRRARGPLIRLRQAVRDGLLARAVFVRQLLASLAVVASYVGVYLCCMRMIGIDAPLASAAPLVPWVLLAMAIPLSVAGWGIREGAAALLWQAGGLDPAQGVAISISYGLVVLLSSLPGALVLARPAPGAASAPG